MTAEIPLWELLLYGAFCLSGGVFIGWILWKAKIKDKRRPKAGPLSGRGR